MESFLQLDVDMDLNIDDIGIDIIDIDMDTSSHNMDKHHVLEAKWHPNNGRTKVTGFF